MYLVRLKQIIHYGWEHAKIASSDSSKNTLCIFFDILFCFFRYKMWSNQYLVEKFHKLDSEHRDKVGKEYLKKGIIRDKWQKDFQANRLFLKKYTNIKVTVQ